MNRSLEHFIDPAYVYRFTQGPNAVRSIEDAKANGVNCVALAHLALNYLFNYQLPTDLNCMEMYRDRRHFITVETPEDMQTGDLVWFGLANPQLETEEFTPVYQANKLVNWQEFPVKHVGIFNGEMKGDYRILHTTHIEGTNAVWPLAKFARYERYREVYKITRLVTQLGTNEQ